MIIDKALLGALLEQAMDNPRKRQPLDMRTSTNDTSRRMLNAMLPGTVVDIDKHDDTDESIICISGRMDVIIYEEEADYHLEEYSHTLDVVKGKRYKEVERYNLCPMEGKYGFQIPKGVWHTVEIIEPSVIFEAKDGPYVPKAY